MTMVVENRVSPESEMEPKKKGSTFKFCCAACGILFVLVVGGVVLMFLFAEKSCDTGDFKLPEMFRPSPTVPVPPGGSFPEDFSNLPEYTIISQYRDSMTIGVDPDTGEEDLKKLNRYLGQTYFPGMSVFNISYFSSDNTTELIAVYNYNSFTGTDNFTILPAQPGARFPAE